MYTIHVRQWMGNNTGQLDAIEVVQWMSKIMVYMEAVEVGQ